jgi:hypothetical protein
MPAGVGMEEGMGMLKGSSGAPTGDDYGPSLGRGLGVGSTNDQAVGNTPLSPDKAMVAMPGMQGMHHEGMQMQEGNMGGDVSPNANHVPGFPQDAYMEGAMMQMDNLVKKPLNYGLRPGWSGFMQGMMSFVRVLPPDKYDEVMEQVRQSGAAK